MDTNVAAGGSKTVLLQPPSLMALAASSLLDHVAPKGVHGPGFAELGRVLGDTDPKGHLMYVKKPKSIHPEALPVKAPTPGSTRTLGLHCFHAHSRGAAAGSCGGNLPMFEKHFTPGYDHT
jgi:hypothetical protein